MNKQQMTEKQVEQIVKLETLEYLTDGKDRGGKYRIAGVLGKPDNRHLQSKQELDMDESLYLQAIEKIRDAFVLMGKVPWSEIPDDYFRNYEEFYHSTKCFLSEISGK